MKIRSTNIAITHLLNFLYRKFYAQLGVGLFIRAFKVFFFVRNPYLLDHINIRLFDTPTKMPIYWTRESLYHTEWKSKIAAKSVSPIWQAFSAHAALPVFRVGQCRQKMLVKLGWQIWLQFWIFIQQSAWYIKRLSGPILR